MAFYNFNNPDQDNSEEMDQAEFMSADININDPQETIDNYFELFLNANSEDEIYELVTELYGEAHTDGYKSSLLSHLQDILEEVHDIAADEHSEDDNGKLDK